MIDVASFAWIITGAVKTEILKSKQLELTDDVKKKINEEGIYHITSKESAEKIMNSGYILPSKGVTNNHFTKSRYGSGFADLVYMFAGKPSEELFKTNLSHKLSKDGTIYAIKHTPNKFDINNYTERLEDSAITHEGRLDITNSNPELVRMKLEKGKLVEIPWDEPVKGKFSDKLRTLPIIKTFAGLPSAFKELNRNVMFRDKEGKLKHSKEIRRQENLMLEQYNNDTQKKNFEIEKDGEKYTVETIGTKMNDGRALTGFNISKGDGTEFSKNVFTDAIDITSISEENLGQFLSENMNKGSVRSEYIGKPVIKDGKIEQVKDEEYSHHFYNKQLMTVKNDVTYASYVEKEESKKNSQLKSLGNLFKSISPQKKEEAIAMIKTASTKGFKDVIEKMREMDRDDIESFCLGG